MKPTIRVHNDIQYVIQETHLRIVILACLLAWCFAQFFTPIEYKMTVKLMYFLIIPMIGIALKSIIDITKESDLAHNASNRIFFQLLSCTVGVLLIIALHSTKHVVVVIRYLSVVLLLLFVYDFHYTHNPIRKQVVNEIFYFTFLAGIAINMILFGKNSDAVFFPGIGDKNITGVFVFLFFCYCWHYKRIMGICVCLIFILFMSGSRSLYGMMLLFFMVKYFRPLLIKISSLKLFKWRLSLKSSVHLLLLFLFTMGLSFYWINNIATAPLDAYREGFNDASNKMRFGANLYGLHKITEKEGILFIGYGDTLKEEWGIEEETPYSEHTRYLGVRLVQPHNCVLNLVLRLGLLPGILYLIFLGRLLDHLRCNRNLEYYLPLLINGCFMHSLFSGPFLVFWAFLLYITKYDPQPSYKLAIRKNDQ